MKTIYLKQLIQFLKDNMLSQFGFPEKFITNNSYDFMGPIFTKFRRECGILMGHTSNFYPQGNGLAQLSWR